MKEKIGTSALKKKYKLVGSPLASGNVRNYPSGVYDVLLKSDKRSDEDKAQLAKFKGKRSVPKTVVDSIKRWLKEEGIVLCYDIEKRKYELKKE